MSESSERIDALADRLLASDAVDWAAELESAGPDERELILALRDIARVAEVNRTFEQALDSNRPTVPRMSSSGQESLPQRWGHLEIIEKVGAGASATVFRARDPHLNREAALKLFHFARPASPEIKQALMEEGRNLAQVKHNNVVTIYGADEQEGRVALWMEFVRGQTIHDLVAKQGTLSADEATAVGVELCRALAAVHARDLVHGDIKAQNVMREAGGRIVLMDFSTSRAAAATEGSKGRFLGTPLYMAPELFKGESVSNQSDVYSLGVLLFYMVTGKYPVKAETAEELREAHKKGEQVLLSDVRPDLPDDFVASVEKALARDPDQRFQSAGALKAALVKGVETAKAKQPSILRRVTTWVGILAASTATLVFLGFVNSMAFNVSLGRPIDFASETALDWFVWGFRSIFPHAGYMVLVLVLVMLLVFLARTLFWAVRRMSSRLDSWLGTLGTRLTSTVRRAGFARPSSLAQALFAAGFLTLIALVWSFSDLISAASTLLDQEFDPSTIAVLHPDNWAYHQWYGRALDLLILALLVGSYKVYLLSKKQEVSGPRGPLVATVAVIAAAILLLVFPYRILWHSDSFERIEFDGQRGYVIGEKGDEILIHSPDAAAPRNRVVEKADPRIRRLNKVESIFEQVDR